MTHWLLALSLMTLQPLWGGPQRTPKNLTQGITNLTKRVEQVLTPNKRKDLSFSVAVANVHTGELLYERNGDKLLMPASVSKVVTSYVAMKRLKPTSTFKTQVFATGPVRDGTLGGSLYLKGGGDPSLVSERMWMLVNELLRSGVRKIPGDIFADGSYYDIEKVPDTRPKYLRDQAYNAPLGALSFNFNTTTVYVRPGENEGTPPIVFTDPQNSYVDIVNQATTGSALSRNSLVATRTDFVEGDIGDTVLLRGSIPLDTKELRFYRNIVNPALYTGHMFKMFLEQRGIAFLGNVKEGETPKNAKLLVEFDSLPLWQIIWGLNKFSNNFVADQILKKISADAWGAPGTMDGGLKALQDSLENIGLPKNSYKIVDGSGLNRETRLSAKQITKVLNAAHRDFSVSAEYMASFGVAGQDGTLKRRFANTRAESLLRAKTGSIDGVNALAGYVASDEGLTLSFAILLNDPKLKYGNMSSWVDRIALAISELSRG